MKAVSWRDICTHMFIAELFRAQELEITQTSTERGMKKQNVIHTSHGILCSLKKEGNSITYYNMEELWGHCKWNEPVTKGQVPSTVGLHLDEAGVSFMETEGDCDWQGLGEGQRGIVDWAPSFNSARWQGFKDQFHNSVNILNTARVHTYKGLRWHILYVFLTIIKISIVFI